MDIYNLVEYVSDLYIVFFLFIKGFNNWYVLVNNWNLIFWFVFLIFGNLKSFFVKFWLMNL